MKNQPVQEEHYGQIVWVNKDVDSIRREECLCLHCDNLKPGQPDNCPAAAAMWPIIVKYGLAFPVSRCAMWKPKTNRITCPRRMGEAGPWKHQEGLDHWRDDDTCSFCGGLNPELALQLIEQGEQVTPTDKSYKCYVGGSGYRKFYFQHLSTEQREQFTALYNSRKMIMGHPGYFYVDPFFAKMIPREGE